MASYRVKPGTPRLDRDHPLAFGLVAGWVFDEGSGTTVREIHDNAFPATLQASPPWAGSPLGHSVNFNGSTQYASVAGTLWTPGTSNQSWLVWCIPANATAVMKVVAQDATGNRAFGFSVNTDSTGSLVAGKWNCNFVNADGSANLLAASTNAVLTPGELVFLAGVRTGPTSTALYRNGASEIATISNTGTPSVPALNSVTIGRRLLTGAFNFFAGNIVQVLHYSRALSAGEIAELHFDPFAPFRPQPRTYRVATLVANGNAPGSTISVTVTITAGNVSASASASGTVSAVIESIVDGVAAGSSVASGTISTVIESIVDGAATGASEVSGTTSSVLATIVDGVAESGSVTPGEIISTTGEIIDGTAAGSASADGVLFADSASLVAGIPSVDASVSGSICVLSTALFITPAREVDDVPQVPLAPSVPQTFASGPFRPIIHHEVRLQENAHAQGVLLSANMKLIPGQARGAVSISSLASGVSYKINTGVLSGLATGENNLTDDEMMFILLEAA